MIIDHAELRRREVAARRADGRFGVRTRHTQTYDGGDASGDSDSEDDGFSSNGVFAMAPGIVGWLSVDDVRALMFERLLQHFDSFLSALAHAWSSDGDSELDALTCAGSADGAGRVVDFAALRVQVDYDLLIHRVLTDPATLPIVREVCLL